VELIHSADAPFDDKKINAISLIIFVNIIYFILLYYLFIATGNVRLPCCEKATKVALLYIC
jgi:hypothetical protein